MTRSYNFAYPLSMLGGQLQHILRTPSFALCYSHVKSNFGFKAFSVYNEKFNWKIQLIILKKISSPARRRKGGDLRKAVTSTICLFCITKYSIPLTPSLSVLHLDHCCSWVRYSILQIFQKKLLHVRNALPMAKSVNVDLCDIRFYCSWSKYVLV